MNAVGCRWLGSFAGVLIATASVAPNARGADPTMSDCITANENAGKLEADKKLRQAREQAAMCAAEACPVELHNTCRQRVADLNHAIPTIVFRAKDSSGSDLTAVKVLMDGQAIAERLEGTAISVDPGQHTFRFEAVSQPPLEQTLLVQEGEKDRTVSVAFGAPASAGSAPAVTPAHESPSPPGSSSALQTALDEGGSWSTQKTLALAIGGVGVAGVVVGGVFGALASSRWSSAKSECFGGTCPSYAQAVSDQDSASTMATVSTVAFIAGGVAVATGAFLWITAPRPDDGGGSTGSLQIAPSFGAGGAGLAMKGAF